MSKRAFIFLMMFLLTASVPVWAQRGGGGGGGGGGNGGGGGGGGAAMNPALNPRAKTPEEKTAALAVGELVKDPAATSDQMDKAIADFVTTYPKSDYVFQINRAGVQFYSQPNHGDAAKLVEYGQKALKIVGNDGYTLSTAGKSIVEFEKPDDPNLAENLKFADACNKKALEVVKAMPDQAAGAMGRKGASSNGSGVSNNDPDAALAKVKAEKAQLAWLAYVSLGRSAAMQKKYPDALANFDKALPVSDFDPAHADVPRGWVYLYTARAQEGAGDMAAAGTSLDEAAKAAGTTEGLSQEIAAEQAKVKAAH